MVLASVDRCALLEVLVILFQLLGVVGLGLSRLAEARWAERGRFGFILAMIGLGLSGALLGMYDSEFALFAGGTLTALLVGMTWSGPSGEIHTASQGVAVEGSW